MKHYSEMTMAEKAQELRCSIAYHERLLFSGDKDAWLPGKIGMEQARLRSFEAQMAQGAV